MSLDKPSIEYYRRHADQARKLAKQTSDPKLKRTYETIAREFESLIAKDSKRKALLPS
jgi:protein involved in sex pheromone biosynthesis